MVEDNFMIPKQTRMSLICSLLVLTFISGLGQLSWAQEKSAPKKGSALSQTKKQTSKALKKDADYWFRKGALVATYGNDKVAIQYFGKAIALDPNHSRAYFEQGIAYGQIGDYQQAISLINRALKLDPQNGIYHYGRGRVYLLSGDDAKAMEDFKHAAELGDEDALNYLDYIGQPLQP
jgi:tetratricopeptide (TPR) repeat protein